MLTATKPATGMKLSLTGEFKPSKHRRRSSGERHAIRPRVLELESRCLLSSGPVLYAINDTDMQPPGNATLYTINPINGATLTSMVITPTDGNTLPDEPIGLASRPGRTTCMR